MESREHVLDRMDIRRIVEALIFASDEPLSASVLRQLIVESKSNGAAEGSPSSAEADSARPTSIGIEDIRAIIASLDEEYRATHRAFRIVEVAGGYQFATLPEFAEWVGRLFREHARRRLSQSALETLSIIAYKQPVSKQEIENIRGVNAEYVLKTLLEKNLITIVGRASTVGRPLLYGTTEEFLKYFGLRSLDELPKLKEIDELLGDDEDIRQRVLRELRDRDSTVSSEELDLFMKEHLRVKESETSERSSKLSGEP